MRAHLIKERSHLNMSQKELFIIILFIFGCYADHYVLKHVVVFSRHGIRTPLGENLRDLTPLTWPIWSQGPGLLTDKGYEVERHMGTYFSEWLKKVNLIKSCDDENSICIYSNVKQRTLKTAEAFKSGAFQDCNVTIHHTDDKDFDPVFNPVIHNTTEEFKIAAVREMEKTLNSLQLNESLILLSNILDFKNSKMCKEKSECDLLNIKNTVHVEAGNKPTLHGPIKLGNSVSDAFIMQYFEGLPSKNVAWGKMNNKKKWFKMVDITNGYHNVIFNSSILARDISKPVIQYIRNTFVKETNKFTLLVGHDANVLTILDSLDFTPFKLEHQYEKTPVSGKIVFQKWHSIKQNKDVLKIEYVYQSNYQMRHSVPLSLKNPPKKKTLSLKCCKIDENGFCPWDIFMQLLNNLVI